VTLTFDLTLKLSRFLEVVKIYVRANFIKLTAATYEWSCWQKKKLSDDAENNTTVASAASSYYIVDIIKNLKNKKDVANS